MAQFNRHLTVVPKEENQAENPFQSLKDNFDKLQDLHARLKKMIDELEKLADKNE